MGNGAAVSSSKLNISNALTETEKKSKSGYYYENYSEYSKDFEEAIRTSSLDIIELLILAGDVKKFQPVHKSVLYNNLEVLQLLYSAGFDLNSYDRDGNLPIHIASKSKHEDSFLILSFLCLEAPRVINAKNKFGHTPLHLSISSDNLPSFAILIQFGANIYSKDNQGLSCLKLAKKLNRVDMLNSFKEFTNPKSKETVIDTDRIMLVWEKFFENATSGFLTESQNEIEYIASANSNLKYSELLDWFQWYLCYFADGKEIVINVINYDTVELSGHLDRFHVNQISEELPNSIESLIRFGWIICYDIQENFCYWYNVQTQNSEHYLPIGGDNLIDKLNLNKYDNKWVSVNQDISYLWLMIYYYDDNNDLYNYYYHEVVGCSQYEEPKRWDEILALNKGWILCCYEDDYDNRFWVNGMS